jgi:hypothetical protein
MAARMTSPRKHRPHGKPPSAGTVSGLTFPDDRERLVSLLTDPTYNMLPKLPFAWISRPPRLRVLTLHQLQRMAYKLSTTPRCLQAIHPAHRISDPK